MKHQTREVLAHLVRALSRYEKELARDGHRTPPEFATLRDFLLDCATPRQDATNSAPNTTHRNDGHMTTELNPMLTKREASSYLRVSVRTLERLISSGALVAVSVAGNATRVRRTDLDAYVASLAPTASFRAGITSKDTA